MIGVLTMRYEDKVPGTEIVVGAQVAVTWRELTFSRLGVAHVLAMKWEQLRKMVLDETSIVLKERSQLK